VLENFSLKRICIEFDELLRSIIYKSNINCRFPKSCSYPWSIDLLCFIKLNFKFKYVR
jgi:hypothetical protein